MIGRHPAKPLGAGAIIPVQAPRNRMATRRPGGRRGPVPGRAPARRPPGPACLGVAAAPVCLQRLAHELVVVAVGSVDHHAERHTASVSEHRAFDPAFGAIGRVGAGFSPHPRLPCPSPRPTPAMSSRCQPPHRRPADLHARRPRTRRLQPIPESAGAPKTTSRCSSRSARSTATPFAKQRRSRPSPHGPAHAGCDTPKGASAVAAATPPSVSKARPADATHHLKPNGASLPHRPVIKNRCGKQP